MAGKLGWERQNVKYFVIQSDRRFLSRRTSLSPDHTSSTAATFTSTRPVGRAIARTTSSVMSVATPDDFLGHEIHRAPAGSRARSRSGTFDSSNVRLRVKNWMKGNVPRAAEATTTPGGKLPSVAR